MSTENINISRDNVQGKCDLKCAYNFNYSESNCTAKNNGVMINLTYDNRSTSPVLYNNQKYNVSGIMITSPSVHNFNGNKVAAEIVVEHSGVLGGPQLFVAIPIISSSNSSSGSNLIKEVIESVATNAPRQGDSTNLNISGFTLQNIVPNKPFFSYTSSDKNEYIVFGILEAIPINNSTLTKLGKIIKPFPVPMKGNALFLNSSGPNTTSTNGSDGIYISCKPTGSSKEETAVEYTKNTPSYDLSKLLDNPITMLVFQIIIGCFIFIILFIFISYVYRFLTSGSTKLPNAISKIY
jgi:carbonic anhydrase